MKIYTYRYKLTATLFICACGLLHAQTDGLYVSDAAGMIFHTCRGLRDAEYVVRLNSTVAMKRKTLYKDAKPIKVWLTEYSGNGQVRREALEEHGILVEEVLFDEARRPQTERLFIDGSANAVEITYTYDNGRLRTKQSVTGGETKTATFFYAPDGRLARLTEQLNEKASVSGTSSPRSGSAAYWHASNGVLDFYKYDEYGRLARLIEYKGVDIQKDETRSWNGDVLEKSRISYSDGSEETKTFVQEGKARGRVSDRFFVAADKSTEYETFIYNTDGRLVKSEKKRGEALYISEHFYDASGMMSKSVTTLNGKISAVIVYTTATTKIEEAYDNGVLFARTYYNDGRRTREEIIKNGKVARVRTFE